MTTSDSTIEELSSDLVVYAARLVRAIRRAHEQPAGTRVLSLLDQYGALGVTALAAADRCSQPTMSGTVAQLVGLGWVAREPNPDDARSNLVSLTDAGRAQLAEVRATNGAYVAGLLADRTRHGTAEIATAVAVLRDLLDTPDTTDHHGGPA